MRNIKCIIFDLDGTLVDSTLVKKKIWLEFVTARGGALSDVEKVYDKYNGLPRRQFINSIMVALEESPLSDKSFLQFNKYLKNRFNPNSVSLFPDTKAALNFLVNQGLKLFISSGAPQCEVDDVANCLEIAPYFSAIFGSGDSFTKGKCHFDRIVESSGLKKSELVFIGNDQKDYEIGTENGIFSQIVDRSQDKIGLLTLVQSILSC